MGMDVITAYFKSTVPYDDVPGASIAVQTYGDFLKHLNLWDIRNHDPPEVEPVYIPELTYVED